ncbi:MAG: hypothetical protein AAF292_11040 [Pseudomonadota bacterium]
MASNNGSISIRVVWDNGTPAEGQKVGVTWDGLMSGFESDYTDNDGWVSFNIFNSSKIQYLTVNDDTVDTDVDIYDGYSASFTLT